MRRVLVFGSFDPLHEGHISLFRRARKLGDHLTVIVARDTAIQIQKNRAPEQTEDVRLAAVAGRAEVDEAMLGDVDPDSYKTLESLDFDVLALGYDQKPDDQEVRRILDKTGRQDARFVRLDPYQPERYKSSLLRS